MSDLEICIDCGKTILLSVHYPKAHNLCACHLGPED